MQKLPPNVPLLPIRLHKTDAPSHRISPIATILGLDEYLLLRFSINSAMTTGSERTVGFRLIYIVKIGS